MLSLSLAHAAAPFGGTLIALDAGHGGTETGATNTAGGVFITEAEVNGDVVQALATKLRSLGAHVVVADRLSTRKDRVNDALAKCAAEDVNEDGTADNRKCDILLSVHHNGITGDPTHDGTLVIYNERQDIPLATALHNALTDSTIGLHLDDEGYLNGGYGITVYGHLISALTEAYYITNDCEAELYLHSKDPATYPSISTACTTAGYQLEDRIAHEVDLQVRGLDVYFTGKSSGGGGGGGNGHGKKP